MFNEIEICEQATGCDGAGDYRSFAEQNGYDHCAVIDWTSSAGDWSFIVSQDGEEWFIMTQENNYPRSGFTRSIDTERPFYGEKDNVLAEICDLYF